MKGFSQRLRWDFTPNRIAHLLAEKAASRTPVIDLTESNPTSVGLRIEEAVLVEALTRPGLLDYRPNPKGIRQAREAVASYYSDRNVDVDPDHVLLTASTSEAYAYLFKLLADPGDAILTPQPSYPLFDYLVRLESLETLHYPLTYADEWRIDIEAIDRAINPQVRIAIAVNPNNPTGSYLKTSEIQHLLKVCANNDMALVVDEVFGDYLLAPGPNPCSIGNQDGPLRFTLSGLSKVVGLPQLKLSWIVVSGAKCEAAMERLELIADTYLSVSTPVQLAAAELLGQRERFQRQASKRLTANLTHLSDAVTNMSCKLLKVEGGWYAVLQLSDAVDEEELVLALLDQDDTLVQPGYFYDFPSGAHVVLSLLPETEVFATGVRNLVRHIERY